CRGDDRWCVIAVEDEADWQGLCGVMGDPPWAQDPRFATMASRVEHAAALEAQIADWTRGLEDYELMERCQGAGVAAGVVQSAAGLFLRDPQLAARGFFEAIPNLTRGTVHAPSIPFGLPGTPGGTTHSVSSVGQDNAYVLLEVVGLSETEW